MKKLQVFDPPMCCSSGICGTNVDTKLVTFVSDLEWLKKQGIEVERYGLSFEPQAFVNNEIVKKTLEKEGNNSLPLIIVDNEVVYKGSYPTREKLTEICGIKWKAEYASQEPVLVGVEASNSICGPECDCHQSAVSDKAKKIIFAVVLLIIAGIIAFKFYSKANAAELNTVNNTNQSTILVNNRTSILGKNIGSLSQAKSNGVAFVYVPSKENEGINASAKDAALSAKKALNNKNIKVDLYTLSSPSSNPPAIMVINNGKTKVVSGQITEAGLLQAYVANTQAGCGSGCPCHQK